ncbi:hypothetical protein FSP39_005368 [Pinctada imbricata]|uniref:TIR domain-containing protein n=1 Tax=Pinctada imbricata TaxID=66713 RepID=A0AA89C0U5_PINIB|nr:hypothetical protein FSP39_005368 [Pinctada imbricata]
MDVTNILFQKGFCEIIYDDNPIEKFTNPSKFKVDTSKSYGGGGFFSMKNLILTQFINFTDLGLLNLAEYYKVFNISFDSKNTKLSCDCKLYPILESQFDYIQRGWTTFSDKLKCGTPQGLTNTSVPDIANKKSLRGKMICERNDFCPRGCTCYEQPINRHLVVNCSKAGLNEFPRTLPWFSNMTLHMDGNNIRSLPDVEYLDRIHSLDISNCSITHIASEAIDRLPKGVILNITGNPIREIPNNLILKSVSLGSLKMHCSCDVVNILTWNTYQNDNKNTLVYCQNYGGKSLQEASDQIREMCKDNDNSGIIIAIIFAFICILITCVFAIFYISCGPEILILYRTYIRRNSRRCKTNFENDIYICMDDSNWYLTKWVLKKLVPAIDNLGMRCFLPCRDEPVGERIEESLSTEIDNSRTFIIILSDIFQQEQGDKFKSRILAMGIDRIWHNFKHKPIKNIIAINFDNLNSGNVKNRYVKAILRSRVDIDVTDRNQKVLQRIIEILKRQM